MSTPAALYATSVGATLISYPRYATFASRHGKQKDISMDFTARFPPISQNHAIQMDHHVHLNLRYLTSYERRSNTQPVSLCSYAKSRLAVFAGIHKSAPPKIPYPAQHVDCKDHIEA